MSDWSSDVCSSDLLAEAAKAVVALVEAGLAALQGLLDHRAPDLFLLAALLEKVVDHLGHQIEGLLLQGLRAVGLRLVLAAAGAALALGLALRVGLADQVVVVDEFVAVRSQQIGRASCRERVCQSV